MDEIELKFLNIIVEEMKSKLIEIGAKLKYSAQTEQFPFIKENFDGWDSSKNFLRIRKINNDITITYKAPAKSNSNMTHREEIEIKVDNYENAIKLIESLDFKKGPIFKKHREHYELGNIHFELDTLKDIPTYLEIETKSEQEMIEICKKLDLDINQGKKGTIVEILPEKFK